MNTGQIKKSKSTERFTVIPNGILENKTLSLKAIGLLCYLLRLPKDWVINKTRLHANLKDGRDAVLAAFKELEECGYIETEEIRERGRFVGFNYLVSDIPKKNAENTAISSENPETDKPITENPETVAPIPENPITVLPITDKPNSENPVLLKTDSTKDEVYKGLNNKDAPPVNGSASHGPSNGSSPGLFADEPPPNKKSSKKPKMPAAENLPPGLHQKFIDVYFKWFKDLNGVDPNPSKADFGQIKPMILYFRNIAIGKAKEKNEILDAAGEEIKILEIWQHLLSSWHLLAPYHQARTKLVEINSGLQNLITEIKNKKNGNVNGNNSGKGQKSAPGLGVKDYASSLAARFSSEGGAQ